MAEISISQVTQETGVRASTLRYYEEIGLVRPTRRVGGRRQYDASVLQRLALIHTGQQAGFRLAEVGVLLNTVLDAEAGGTGWLALVQRKVNEMEAMLRHIERMKRLLEEMMACEEAGLADCIVMTGQRQAEVVGE